MSPRPKPPADLDDSGRDITPAFCIEQGDEAFLRGDIKTALRWYTRAIDIDPKSPTPWVTMLRVLLFRGNTEETAAWIHRGETLFPDNPELKALGAVHMARSRMRVQALAESQEVLTRNPSLPLAHLCHGEVLMVTGDKHYDHLFREGLDMVPRHDWKTPLIIGMILRAAGRLKLSIEYLHEAQRRNPESPTIQYHIALTWAAKGQQAQTKRAMQEVRDLCYEHDPLLTRLIYVDAGGTLRWLTGLFK